MKKIFLSLLCLVSCLSVSAVNVLLDLKDSQISATPYTNRSIRIFPMSAPTINNPSVILRAPLTGTTDSNGQLWISNMVVGLYQVTVQAPPLAESFKFLIISNTPSTISVSTNLVADATSTFPAGLVAWSSAVTDARYSPDSRYFLLSGANQVIGNNLFSGQQTFIAKNTFAADQLIAGNVGVTGRLTNGNGLFIGPGLVFWFSGSGDPNGNITAPVGSLYLRTDGGAGSTLYVKESGSGNTGWQAK